MMTTEDQDLFAVDEDVEEVWGRPSWSSPYAALEDREEEGTSLDAAGSSPNLL